MTQPIDHVQSVRRKLIEMHYRANTGHLGSSLSIVEMLVQLYDGVIRPQDHFILSKGHAASALYAVLHEFGHISDEVLATYFLPGTHLAVHPDSGWTDHIPFSTGSLGHGLSLAAGLAYVEKHLKKSDVITYCLISDGEWEEGQTKEALDFIKDTEIGNRLLIMIDNNGSQGFREKEQFTSFPVPVTRTTMGHGISFLEGKLSSHYLPLTKEQYEQALKELE